MPGKIIKVIVNGKELNRDEYTVTGDPPTVTLTPEYLKTLADGKHTITIQGENGYVETTFTVKKAKQGTDQETNPTGAASGTGQSTGVKTGDETNVIGWVMLMLASMVFVVANVILKENKG